MRIFKSDDGKRWVAKIQDGLEDPPPEERTGWEVIQFDPEEGNFQRITYRPSGWLGNATIQDLIAALQEGETVRATWK